MRVLRKRPQAKAVGVLVVLSAALAGCSDDGGGIRAPAADLSGLWSIASEVESNSCGDPNGLLLELYADIQHDGTSNAFSADFYDEWEAFVVSCDGTISGTSVSISRCSYDDDNGVTTSNVSGTLDVQYMWIIGEDNWTWTDGSFSCGGRSGWTAARLY